jgi:hypothetical protein
LACWDTHFYAVGTITNMKAEHQKWLWYGALAVGGYFAVTKGIPWLVTKLGKAGADTAKAAGGAAASATGEAAGAAVTLVPKAIGVAATAVNDFALSDQNPFRDTLTPVTNWLYDWLNPPKPVTVAKTITVNGKTFNIMSDGTSRLVK